MTIKELSALSERDFLSEIWDKSVLTAIDNQHTVPMTMKEFLNHCTACGGNWGGMLLSGLKELYPEVYDAIPDEMGSLAWAGICTTLRLLNVKDD